MERSSSESRYRRFLSPTTSLNAAQLRYLTEVDHSDHEALIATAPGFDEGIGVARFVRSRVDPDVAEFAIAVDDDWQGRGVGTALLDRLTERARAEGVRRFSAEALADNRPVLELIRDLGDVEVKDYAGGVVELEVTLPEEGIGAALRETLRGAARELLSVRHSLR
jgi:GNAT superfamily N-acetyltransferase